jgi:LuxR family transcriptional regulator, maltose regulon positive regulatory protein
MSRAFRYTPPVFDRALVRPRLLERLRTRFERPVTAIVAAPGFGKTTLLAQAVYENNLAPMGEDRWLTCQPADTALSFLASDVFRALGLEPDVPNDVDEAAMAVSEALWSLAPRQVALILDDAHFVTADSAGGRFLAMLIEELPRNGHVVFSARPPLMFRFSRLVTSGAAIVLSEPDMQFQEDELAAFADLRGVPPHLLADVGGWPALAELTANVGPHAATGYVREELLSQLKPERRQALGILAAVGAADAELATALFGPSTDLRRLLSGLPLVARTAGGWYSLHGLWSRILRGQLDPEQSVEARRIAGRAMWRRGIYHDAMDLLSQAEAWEEVRGLIVAVCDVCTPLLPTDVLELWLRRLPREVRDTPEGVLLQAMVAEPVSPSAATNLLERALAAAEDVGGDESGDAATRALDPTAVRYACVNALVLLAFWRSDRPRIKRLLNELADLARRGHTDAPAWVALLTALLARRPEDVRAALAAPRLVSGLPLNAVLDWLHAHILLLKLGDAENAEVLARRALEHKVSTMQAVSRAALMESLRLRGRLPDAEQLLPDLLADLNAPKVLTSPELVSYAVVMLSVLGRREQARSVLEEFHPVMDASPVAWAAISGGIAEAFRLASIGEDVQAAAAVAGILPLSVVQNQAVIQVSPAALPVLYVLAPSLRACWDAEEPPGVFADQLALARALVDLRERGSLDGVTALSVNARHMLRATLPPPWATELAVALVTAKVDSGRALLDDLGQDQRAILRERISKGSSSIAVTARQLLKSMPSAPSQRLQLQTLGVVELRRDGKPVSVPELRRERVRQLLAYVLIHERPTRAAITAELWPDLDDPAASRNLRVTLAYLQNGLEPDRSELDAPYFLRRRGGVLTLVVDEFLHVDYRVFEHCLDEAARLERQGVPSAALVAYERAADTWHGDFFADLPADDWLQWERDRLRGRFVSAALRAADLELARGDAERAVTLAGRALAAEPYSEQAYQTIVAAHLAVGDPVNARRVLGRCQVMLRDLGVMAEQRTIALARQLEGSR